MQGKTWYLPSPATAHCLGVGNCGSCHIFGAGLCRCCIESLRRVAPTAASHSRATAARTRSMTLVSRFRALKVTVSICLKLASGVTPALARSFDMTVAPLNQRSPKGNRGGQPGASGLRRDRRRKSICGPYPLYLRLICVVGDVYCGTSDQRYRQLHAGGRTVGFVPRRGRHAARAGI
jgi:hypothetical protein